MSVAPGSTSDLMQAGALIGGFSLAITLGISAVLSRFVALKSLPDRRAMWTVCPAILVAFAVCEAMVVELGMPFLSFLFVVLPGLGVLWWYRRQFKRAWIPDDQVHEGMKLENDDWRVGVAGILIVLLAALYKFAWRYFAAG